MSTHELENVEKVKDLAKSHLIEGTKIIRLGVDIPMLEYFISRGIKDKDDNPITCTEQFMSIVEETYPKPKKPDKKRPGKNVLNPILGYVKNLLWYMDCPDEYPEYKAYDYIFDNFEYLTGLSTSKFHLLSLYSSTSMIM